MFNDTVNFFRVLPFMLSQRTQFVHFMKYRVKCTLVHLLFERRSERAATNDITTKLVINITVTKRLQRGKLGILRGIKLPKIFEIIICAKRTLPSRVHSEKRFVGGEKWREMSSFPIFGHECPFPSGAF